MIARRTAVTNDLLADDGYIEKVDAIGDPLQKIEAVVDFSALAQAVEKIAPRPEQPKKLLKKSVVYWAKWCSGGW
ncbi:hypothetical protein HAP96_04970, partial [Acidithiobacillus caldus]|nr:hypothetical protein [Acidithiobacillus caldus]